VDPGEPDGRSFDAVPTAAGAIARLAYAHARNQGIDLDPLLKAAGLSGQHLLERSARIKVRHQIHFLDLVAKAVNDPLLGFHLAHTADLREVGLLYYVVTSSETFRDAWRRGARYTSVTNEGLSLAYVEGGDIRMVFDYLGVPRHVDRHQIEFCMAALMRFCRQVTDRQLAPRRVAFTHSAWATSRERIAHAVTTEIAILLAECKQIFRFTPGSRRRSGYPLRSRLCHKRP
jgi:Arabinose-binding domain of AraC transcription regulator, N-term